MLFSVTVGSCSDVSSEMRPENCVSVVDPTSVEISVINSAVDGRVQNVDSAMLVASASVSKADSIVNVDKADRCS